MERCQALSDSEKVSLPRVRRGKKRGPHTAATLYAIFGGVLHEMSFIALSRLAEAPRAAIEMRMPAMRMK